jgi:hypothetical protein
MQRDRESSFPDRFVRVGCCYLPTFILFEETLVVHDPTRRSFNYSLLSSLTAYGLIEALFQKDAFADKVKPIINQWMIDLNTLSKDLKVEKKLKDTEFQKKLEELYRRVDLPELLKLLDLDKVVKSAKLPDNGANSVGIDLRKVEGLPEKLSFGKQIFCMKKG